MMPDTLFHKNKIVFIAMCLITLAVLAVILTLLVNVDAFKQQIESTTSKALGLEVRLNGSIGIALFPVFGLSLKDVNIRSAGVDVGTIETIRIGLKVIPLAIMQFKINQVVLFKPRFSIGRQKNGMSGFKTSWRTLWGKLLSLKKISISGGSLVYANEVSIGPIEVGDLDLTIVNHSPGEQGRSKAFDSTAFLGNIRCKRFKLHNLTLTNLMMKTTLENGILEFNPVRLNIFGGTGSGSLQADMTVASPKYKVIYALTEARIEDLFQQYALEKEKPQPIEGLINFSADLTAMGLNADEVKRSLTGELSLNGENLMLNNIDIDALIMKYERSQNFNLLDVGAFLLAGPFGPLLTKSYDLASLYEESLNGKTRIEKLVSVWKVKNGVAEARDVALATKKRRIAMKGGLSFINEQFVDVTIAALDKLGCSVYSEKVNGPFREPRIEKETVFTSIAGAVLNPVQDAWELIQGQECTVFYSGSVAQPEG